jgi:hypothetical protein
MARDHDRDRERERHENGKSDPRHLNLTRAADDHCDTRKCDQHRRDVAPGDPLAEEDPGQGGG